MQRDRQSILDIIVSIELIFGYSQDIDWSEISTKNQDAIILRLIVIGEATKRLSLGLRDRHPQIPWKQMAGLRDIIVHKYDGIDLAIIRDVVVLELPNILPLLQDLIDSTQ